MDTKDYTVTDQAGPKVAGRAVAPGETVTLTEPQARAELLDGAIVEKGKEAKAVKAEPTKALPDTQARARGADSAKAEAKAEAAETPSATAPAN